MLQSYKDLFRTTRLILKKILIWKFPNLQYSYALLKFECDRSWVQSPVKDHVIQKTFKTLPVVPLLSTQHLKGNTGSFSIILAIIPSLSFLLKIDLCQISSLMKYRQSKQTNNIEAGRTISLIHLDIKS